MFSVVCLLSLSASARNVTHRVRLDSPRASIHPGGSSPHGAYTLTGVRPTRLEGKSCVV